MFEKPSNPAYYPTYYFHTVPRRLKDDLADRDLTELQSWYAGLGKTYDIVMDLHDNTPPLSERDYTDQVAREYKRGFITKEGFLAYSIDYAPFVEVNYCYRSTGDMGHSAQTLSGFRPRPSKPYLRVAAVRECEYGLGIGTLELRLEFYPALLVGRNRARLKKFPVDTGVSIVAQLIEFVRAL